MKKKGFTLIEIMIVLAVFSVGVLAVLRLILNNMSTMDTLQTRSTATFLAKEGLELVYNIRDTNRIAALPRNCIINKAYDGNLETDTCKYKFLDESGLWKIEINTTDNISMTPINQKDKLFESTKLFIKTDNKQTSYTHKETESPSIFARYITFTGIKENETTLPTDQILKIESHVLYQKGGKNGEVVLEGFIGNY